MKKKGCRRGGCRSYLGAGFARNVHAIRDRNSTTKDCANAATIIKQSQTSEQTSGSLQGIMGGWKLSAELNSMSGRGRGDVESLMFNSLNVTELREVQS